MNEDYRVSADKTMLDIDAIHEFLSTRSYWARGRTRETVVRSIENSLCFGVYDARGKMVAFARVATDCAVFSYLMDVFVLEGHRGRGLGKKLMDYITSFPPLQGLKRWQLATADAHGLYRRYGFRELAEPEKHMEKVP